MPQLNDQERAAFVDRLETEVGGSWEFFHLRETWNGGSHEGFRGLGEDWSAAVIGYWTQDTWSWEFERGDNWVRGNKTPDLNSVVTALQSSVENIP